MVDAPSSLPERDALAAELTLGLLEGQERSDALRLCLSDPDFAREVEAWKARLAPLLDDMASVAAPEGVWPAIEARIAMDKPGAGVRSLRRWRASALLSGAVAASLALFIALRPADVPRAAPVAVSQLADAKGVAAITIAYRPETGELSTTPISLAKGGRSPELWAIPEDGVPRSLGIMPSDSHAIAVGEPLRRFLKNGTTLAITLEDAASAPHKAPSAAPILTGKISII